MLLGALDNAEPLPASLDPATVGQFARNRLAARDRQYPFDTGCVWRIPVDGEPAPQCTSSDRNRSGCDCNRVRRVDTGGELLKAGVKVIVHGEEVGDRIVGIMGGYIRWAGLVDDDTQAITVTGSRWAMSASSGSAS